MKKLWLISTLSLGLVFVAGCTIGQKGSSDVMSVYNESNEMTCTLSYSSDIEEWKSTIYIKDNMFRQDMQWNYNWEDYAMYSIAKDGKLYTWWDIYGDIGIVEDYELDIDDLLWAFEDIDDNTTISCVKGVRKSSVFDLPKDVSFDSADDLFELWDEDLLGLTEELGDEDIANEEVVNEEVADEAEVNEEAVAEEVAE